MTDEIKQGQSDLYRTEAVDICRYILDKAIKYAESNKDSSASNPVNDRAFLSSLEAYDQTHLHIAHKAGSIEEKSRPGRLDKEIKGLRAEVL